MPTDGIGTFDLPFAALVVVGAFAFIMITLTCVFGMGDKPRLGLVCFAAATLLLILLLVSLWTELSAATPAPWLDLRKTVITTVLAAVLWQVGRAASSS